MAVYRDMFL